MAFTVGHVHIKTKEPKKTAQFYIDNFGATMKREVDGRGFQLDLHGLQLNVTTIIDTQKHEQKLGIEHIALQTDDYAGTDESERRQDRRRAVQQRPPRLLGRSTRRCADGSHREGVTVIPGRPAWAEPGTQEHGTQGIGATAVRAPKIGCA
jgi:hypothetical protein